MNTASFGYGMYWASTLPFRRGTFSENWSAFKSSNASFHEMGNRWMHRMLPGDHQSSIYQQFRGGMSSGLDLGLAMASGVGIAKGVYTVANMGYSLTKGAINARRIGRATTASHLSLPKVGPKGFEHLIKSNPIDNLKTTIIPNASKTYWSNSLNPFKGKSFEELDQIFRAKGFKLKGPDPLHGKGAYFSPNTNRKYYLDYAGKKYKGGVTELPHVDVHYNISVNGIEKKRFPIGEHLYEFE